MVIGTAVVQYTYDAWGKILTTTGSMASTLGVHNPLRYRGYVYDTETGLYYLQSRYYDPQMGRFINADALVSTGQGILGNNMFAYCLNDPVNYCDPTGNFAGDLTVNGVRGASSGNAGAGYGGGIIVTYPLPSFISEIEEYANEIKAWVESQKGIRKYRDNSIYVLKDPNDHYLVKYVGRTNDPERREQEHKNDPLHPQRKKYRMVVLVTALTKEQAMIWEQLIISAYTVAYLENARREIAVKNVPKYLSYVNAITEIYTGIPGSEISSFISRR